MTTLTNDQRTRFSKALRRLHGDEETLIVLAQMVAEDAPALFEQLDASIRSAPLADAAAAGHALKGLLSTFETGPPVSDLQPLIDAARSGDVKAATFFFADVRPSLDRLVTEIRDVSVMANRFPSGCS